MKALDFMEIEQVPTGTKIQYDYRGQVEKIVVNQDTKIEDGMKVNTISVHVNPLRLPITFEVAVKYIDTLYHISSPPVEEYPEDYIAVCKDMNLDYVAWSQFNTFIRQFVMYRRIIYEDLYITQPIVCITMRLTDKDWNQLKRYCFQSGIAFVLSVDDDIRYITIKIPDRRIVTRDEMFKGLTSLIGSVADKEWLGLTGMFLRNVKSVADHAMLSDYILSTLPR